MVDHKDDKDEQYNLIPVFPTSFWQYNLIPVNITSFLAKVWQEWGYIAWNEVILSVWKWLLKPAIRRQKFYKFFANPHYARF